jgi:hypothetical protein
MTIGRVTPIVTFVVLAAIVVMVSGSPEGWPPPTRGIERARAEALAALFRARGRGSLNGVLDACETFAALGDREVVAACVRIARGLAGADRADDRLRALERLGARASPPNRCPHRRNEPCGT